MIQLTPQAIEAVKSAMSRATGPAAGLRIMVDTLKKKIEIWSSKLEADQKRADEHRK